MLTHYLQADHRFMIDYVMYRRMHPGNHHKFALYGRDDLGPEAMRQDEPPSDDFLATLPAEIHGFEFETKGWSEVPATRWQSCNS